MTDAATGNVFVLCTGRCGSTTFAKAASHAVNFTSGHESRSRMFGTERLAYPSGHIEVDNRLTWMLGRLNRQFGASAHYVHLLRDPLPTAESFVARKDLGIMAAYRRAILMHADSRDYGATPLDLALDMLDTVSQNILLFLKDKPNVTTVRMETIETDFPLFWNRIGARGDLNAAMAEWSVRHNATPA